MTIIDVVMIIGAVANLIIFVLFLFLSRGDPAHSTPGRTVPLTGLMEGRWNESATLPIATLSS